MIIANLCKNIEQFPKNYNLLSKCKNGKDLNLKKLARSQAET